MVGCQYIMCKIKSKDFPGGPVVKTLYFKSPHIACCGWKIKKKNKLKSRNDTQGSRINMLFKNTEATIMRK